MTELSNTAFSVLVILLVTLPLGFLVLAIHCYITGDQDPDPDGPDGGDTIPIIERYKIDDARGTQMSLKASSTQNKVARRVNEKE